MTVTIPMTIEQLSNVLASGIDDLPKETSLDFYFHQDDDELYGVRLMRLFEEQKGVISFGCYTDDSLRVCTRACGVSQLIFDENEDRVAEAIQTQLEVWMITESNGNFKSEDQLLYVVVDIDN